MSKSYIFKGVLNLFLWGLSILSFFYSFVFITISDNIFDRDGKIGIFLIFISLLFVLLAKKKNHIEKVKCERVLSSLKGKDFSPYGNLEVSMWRMGKYIGFDDKNRTILILSLFESPQVIKGFDFSFWTGYECKGSAITFKFNDVNFPCFVIAFRSEEDSMCFCHKLDVLLSPQYQSKEVKDDFGELVQQKLQAA